MGKYTLVVETSARPSRDDEFNDWYDNIHIPEVLEVPGIVAAERFVLHGSFIGDEPVNRYLAFYELETDDPDETLRVLDASVPQMFLSEAWDNEPTRAITYKLITPRMDRAMLAARKADKAVAR
jgi:hypothetical protein